MDIFGLTDRGKVRSENQDSFLLDALDDESCAMLVLCDGMGGAQAGSTASFIASESFILHTRACLELHRDAKPLREIVYEAANYANIRVYDRSYGDFSCMGMGTTLVGALVREDDCYIVNIGDSRAYHISPIVHEITRITRDHSLVEELVRRGRITREEAKTHPRKNVITRALGVEQSMKCDIFPLLILEGDVLLLCSDGLSNLVSDEEILDAVLAGPDAESICRGLIDTALERGAPDNVTIVIFIR